MSIKIDRKWCMPNKNTFSMKPVSKLLNSYISGNMVIVDPFARNSKIGTITNDLNPNTSAMYHLDVLDFLKNQPTHSADIVLYDPPYSSRQVSECYNNVGHKVTSLDTSARWRKNHLDEIKRILKHNGICISFGWNTNGVGKTRGFEIIQILILAHGGSHNDTLVTVERKVEEDEK
ncbi:MAG TPA: hypothetical protein K8V13_15030 [Enterobacter roggenkampii]|nr:hypothetical protein [Enterobacter roggenkampii]